MFGTSLKEELEQRGISRRDFLGFCGSMAAVLGLPATARNAIAQAVETERKPILVWLEFQDCAGNTEAFLRASHPTVADLILDSISLNYHETIMAAAGHQAEDALAQTVRENAGKYIALVEGSIPTGADGAFPRRARTQPVQYRSPMPCRGSKTASTCRRAPPTPRTSPR